MVLKLSMGITISFWEYDTVFNVLIGDGSNPSPSGEVRRYGRLSGHELYIKDGIHVKI